MSSTSKENRQKAETLYKSGSSLADIARELNISKDTVRTWKSRYAWARDEKKIETEKKKKSVSKSVSKIIETKPDELTEKEELFCQAYIRRFNATRAYLEVYGCGYNTAMTEGSRLLGKHKIQNRINELKLMKVQGSMLSEADIVQQYIDIAFCDIDDFVSHGSIMIETKNGDSVPYDYVSVKPAGTYDGRLVRNIRKTKTGLDIQPPTMAEKMKALEWLSTHVFNITTDAERARIESLKSKVEVEKERLQLAKDAVW